jgi:hypothetical protein
VSYQLECQGELVRATVFVQWEIFDAEPASSWLAEEEHELSLEPEACMQHGKIAHREELAPSEYDSLQESQPVSSSQEAFQEEHVPT